jgi:hypothetical protein
MAPTRKFFRAQSLVDVQSFMIQGDGRGKKSKQHLRSVLGRSFIARRKNREYRTE